MVKKAALLNDISGLGKCSLAAGISVITAMGIQACPVPLSVYTAQTGFPGYECTELTSMIHAFRRMWKDSGTELDGILTGFMQNDKQADEIISFAGDFHNDGNILLVDPVMADHGKYYANYSLKLLDRIRTLAASADIITPNISELCLLAGEEMETVLSLSGNVLEAELRRIGMGLWKRTGTCVVVTGIPVTGDDGEELLGNMICSGDGDEMVTGPCVRKAFSGTGDLFAAVVLGSLINGEDVLTGVRTAGEFIMNAARSASENNVDTNHGTDYEKYLWMLSDTDRKTPGSV